MCGQTRSGPLRLANSPPAASVAYQQEDDHGGDEYGCGNDEPSHGMQVEEGAFGVVAAIYGGHDRGRLAQAKSQARINMCCVDSVSYLPPQQAGR